MERLIRFFVERHLLQGNEYSASRDGKLIVSPRPFLPPLFLLQAKSGASLRAALSSFGVATFDHLHPYSDGLSLVAAADSALYSAKEFGRDRCVHASDPGVMPFRNR